MRFLSAQPIEFRDPWVLFLVPVIFLIVYLVNQRKSVSGFVFPSLDILKNVSSSWKVQLIHLPTVLRLIVLSLLIIALAGPRSVLEQTETKTEGVDIILALDTSGSMAAEDFMIKGQRQSRIEIIKSVVEEFIKSRPSDRLGIVAFASKAYTLCPLTTDYDWLEKNLERLELGLIEDGTAIGSGIMSSINRLKNSSAKSKVIILLTDGVNNAGKIDPLSAAKMARTYGIKVYTIGTGTKGYAPFPVMDAFGRKFYQNVLIDIDEETLSKIAEETQAKYFRATDTESLRHIYQEIDNLEKTKIEHLGFKEYKELFFVVLLLALILLLIEIILSQTILLKVP